MRSTKAALDQLHVAGEYIFGRKLVQSFTQNGQDRESVAGGGRGERE